MNSPEGKISDFIRIIQGEFSEVPDILILSLSISKGTGGGAFSLRLSPVNDSI